MAYLANVSAYPVISVRFVISETVVVRLVSLLKKLVKEFKKLPYENGVAMGFSMIEDDTKLVEDAFNEASIQMRENKELEEKNNG